MTYCNYENGLENGESRITKLRVTAEHTIIRIGFWAVVAR